ncbi:MAG: MAPEG family protein [Rhodobacter sp.]|nr:MAPEG family protein [Rhodobacter sp.]
MSKRQKILAGMAAGLVWAIGIVWIGAALVDIPIMFLNWSLFFAFFFPGLALAAMIARIAQRRFFDDTIIDGEPLSGPAGIDQLVLRNTVEQLVLALALWPFVGTVLATDGPGVVAALGIGFAIARVLFWVGYHISPPLRAFGFAATFYPTLVACVWTVLFWVFL